MPELMIVGPRLEPPRLLEPPPGPPRCPPCLRNPLCPRPWAPPLWVLPLFGPDCSRLRWFGWTGPGRHRATASCPVGASATAWRYVSTSVDSINSSFGLGDRWRQPYRSCAGTSSVPGLSSTWEACWPCGRSYRRCGGWRTSGTSCPAPSQCSRSCRSMA